MGREQRKKPEYLDTRMSRCLQFVPDKPFFPFLCPSSFVKPFLSKGVFLFSFFLPSFLRSSFHIPSILPSSSPPSPISPSLSSSSSPPPRILSSYPSPLRFASLPVIPFITCTSLLPNSLSLASRLFHINYHGPHTHVSGTHIFRSRETTFSFRHSIWKKTRIPSAWGAIAPSKKAASSPLARDCGMFNGKYPHQHFFLIYPFHCCLKPVCTLHRSLQEQPKKKAVFMLHHVLRTPSCLCHDVLQVWYHGIKHNAKKERERLNPPHPCGRIECALGSIYLQEEEGEVAPDFNVFANRKTTPSTVKRDGVVPPKTEYLQRTPWIHVQPSGWMDFHCAYSPACEDRSSCSFDTYPTHTHTHTHSYPKHSYIDSCHQHHNPTFQLIP